MARRGWLAIEKRRPTSLDPNPRVLSPLRSQPCGTGVETKIRGLLKRLRNRLGRRDLRDRVQRALTLRPRGAVRMDRLELGTMRTTMRVDWIARDTHPWDRGLDAQIIEQRLAQQCLEDVDAAIRRLFREITEVDAFEVRVFREWGSSPLLEGLVERSEVATVRHSSPAMRLKSLGIKFQLSEWRLEPLLCDGEGIGAT